MASLFRFCPRCHGKLPVPAFLRSGDVKVQGRVTLGCSRCKKGEVRLRG